MTVPPGTKTGYAPCNVSLLRSGFRTDKPFPTHDDDLRAETLDAFQLPPFSGCMHHEINNNVPTFSAKELALPHGTEIYGPLDYLGRVTGAIACVGQDTMPTQKRRDISSVRPTGWKQARYEELDNEVLDTRAHVIARCLTAEEANQLNLITGTHCMNQRGMNPYEDMVEDYVLATGNHVIYHAAPVFADEELMARGVHLMAQSVEDGGEDISFNVYIYNVEPNVEINYATGESKPSKGNNLITEDSPIRTGAWVRPDEDQ